MINTISNDNESKKYYYSSYLTPETTTKILHNSSPQKTTSLSSKPLINNDLVTALLKFFGFNSTNKEHKAKELAFELTRKFESAGYNSLQTSDDGIISYGLHQATLRSGSLEEIIKEYCNNSTSRTSKEMSKFLQQIKLKDPALKNDRNFLELLDKASLEKEMKDAQNKIFTDNYWKPAYQKANQLNLKSPIAFAIFYDTKIQGGLDSILIKTKAKLLNRTYSEKEFLITFLSERRKYLLQIAAQKSPTQAKMLQNSAYNRVGYLMKLVDKSNS